MGKKIVHRVVLWNKYMECWRIVTEFHAVSVCSQTVLGILYTWMPLSAGPQSGAA